VDRAAALHLRADEPPEERAVSGDIRFWAKRYLDEGWAVFPIPRGEKGPRESGWQKRAAERGYKPEDFPQGCNVGALVGEPSGDRVDVDLDAPEAVSAGGLLLPRTGLVHGRPSKRASHWWFLCKGATRRCFKDPLVADEEATLLEVRCGSGLQTVLPPSLNTKNGPETVEWEQERGPMEIAPADLDKYAAAAAIAALLARYWPRQEGSGRHSLALAAGGFLGRYMEDKELAAQTIKAMLRIAGDPQADLRARAARETIEKLKRGETRVTGGPTFVKDFPHGEQIASRVLSWLGAEDEDAVDRMNDRFFMVAYGTTVVVAEPTKTEVLLWDFEQFDRLFVKHRVQVGKKEVPVSKWWREHKRGAQFDRLVYAPPGAQVQAGPRDYNGWRGFSVEPKAGDWSLNREHVRRVLCGGDAETFEWLLDWAAMLFQQPGRHAETAIVLLGGQGVGKGHFADKMLGRTFDSRHYAHVVDRRRVFGQFNDVLSGRCLLFVDEATWGGDKRDAGIIKGLVTEGTVQIERKHIPAAFEPSMLHIVLASNEKWPVGVDADDRRFCVVRVRDDKSSDLGYFAAMLAELEAGGRAAMLAELLERPVDPNRLRRPPNTDARRDLKVRSLGPEETWWYEKLWEGQLLPFHKGWMPEVQKDTLYEDYVQALQKTGCTRRQFETELGMLIRSLAPGAREVRKRPDLKRWWIMPPLADCRRAFAATLRSRFDWPSEHEKPLPAGRKQETEEL
jgi:hypothetical protein